MAFPVTLNGRTYTLADFEGTNYVDGLPDAFEDFVTHAGAIYKTTSTTSNTIGSGSKSFTTADNSLPYQVGTPLRISDGAAPATNWMDGIVTAYSGTSLTVNVVSYAGSGTLTDWDINIGGGGTSYTGTLPVAQGGTGATTAGAAATNLGLGTGDSPTFAGLDVTGTVTADGLSVARAGGAAGSGNVAYIDVTSSYGGLSINSSTGNNAFIELLENGVKTAGLNSDATANVTSLQADNSHALAFNTGGTNQRMNIADNGDISFYDSTGTSQDLFWDASASSLAIGTTNANSRNLYIQAPGAYIGLNSTAEGYTTIEGLDNGTKRWRIGQVGFGSTDGFAIYTGASDTERVRINNSGDIKIGSGSPSGAKLHIDQGADSNGVKLANSSRGSGYVDWVLSGTLNEGFSFRQYNGSNFNTLSTHTRSEHLWKINDVEVGSFNSNGQFLAGFATSISSALGGNAKARIASMSIISVGISSSATDTGISINQGDGGQSMLMLTSRNTGTGTATASAMYFIKFYYNGNNAPSVTHVAGDNFITFGVSGGNTMTVANPGAGNCNAIFIASK